MKKTIRDQARILRQATLFTFLLFLISTPLFAQNDQRFSLQENDITVREVLSFIENSSSYKFVYSEDLVDLNRKISINVNEGSLEEVLSTIFGSTDVEYKISNNQVVISPHEVINPAAEDAGLVIIQGIVTDPLGEPLPGVNVIEEGTANGTVSGISGEFRLELSDAGSQVQLSYVGFVTEYLKVGKRRKFNVVLTEDITKLDEIVVIGYGTRKKSDITGSVVSMSKERLANLPSTNVLESMQGSMAGVNINFGNSKPGGEPEIWIRGINSITADNAPLVVVDGVPGTGLSNINQNDVESIEVLKDASASAIYGARGANGVILVTTKRGKGKPTVTFNSYFGIKTMTQKINMMNGQTHMQAKMRAYELGGFPSDTADVYTVEEYGNIARGTETDWQDEYMRNANIQEHQLSVSAGAKKTKYYLSVNYGDHDHILQNFNYKRTGLRFNLDQEIGEWLQIGNSLNLTYTKESGVAGNLKNATTMTPWNSPYDEEGNLLMFPANNNFIGNPIAERNIVVDNNRYQIFNNLFAVVQFPVKGLSYRINLGVDVRTNKNNKYQGRDTPLGFNADGIADISTGLTQNWVLENILNYERTFADVHNVKFTGLYSSQEFYRESAAMDAYGFSNDQIMYNNLTTASQFNAPSSSATKSNYLSLMGRLGYNYAEKYYATVTVRQDGYSAFGNNRKFGTFPSFALSWRINEESFMSNVEVISNLKLRASYGMNGNQAVGPYSSISAVVTEVDGLPLAYNFGDAIIYGYFLDKMSNQDLGWETTKSFNLALDYGLFRGRITGSFEYYNSNTEDLLLDRGISWVNGFDNVRSNIGKTHNRGIEMVLTTYNINSRGDGFQWNTNFNASFNHNEILDLYGNQLDDLANGWFIGEPIDVIFDYVFDGIVQEEEDMSGSAQPTALPGDIKVKDLNENGVIDPEDRRIVGVARPDWTLGMTNSFSFKGFDLNIFLQGVTGVTKQNSILNNSTSSGSNQLDVDWWTPETPSNQYPTLRQGKVTSYWSSFQYESADFLRIRDISLGYNFPRSLTSRIHIDKLRLYVSGRNLYTFTNWKGMDPETGSFRNPNTKSIIFGLNLTL